MKIVNDQITDEDDAQMLELMKERLKRIKDGDRLAVEEEEMEDYPLFPRFSVLHYYSAPATVNDFPDYLQRVDRWVKLNQKSIELTIKNKVPTAYKAEQMFAQLALEERHWKTQMEFIDIVMDNPEKHVIGFWMLGSAKQRTLDTLACMNMCSAVVTRTPHDHIPMHSDYKSLKYVHNKGKCKFHRIVTAFRDAGKDLNTVYLCDPTPPYIEYMRLFYPDARIVAIMTPMSTTEQEITEILEIRKKLKDPSIDKSTKFGMLFDMKSLDDETARGATQKTRDFLKAVHAQKTGKK